MILFDTDTVTYFFHGDKNVCRKVDKVGDEVLAITLITRYEMLRGRADNLLKAADKVELRKAVDRFRRTEQEISRFEVVGFDEYAIEKFEKLRIEKKLKKMGRADMLIACIALANNALLVTRNTRDFENVVGLRMENWVDE